MGEFEEFFADYRYSASAWQRIRDRFCDLPPEKPGNDELPVAKAVVRQYFTWFAPLVPFRANAAETRGVFTIRNVLDLMAATYFVGFVTYDQIDALVATSPPGCFAVRASLSRYAISVVDLIGQNENNSPARVNVVSAASQSRFVQPVALCSID